MNKTKFKHQIYFLLILLLLASKTTGQKVVNVDPDSIVANFIENIGGNKIMELDSRIERSTIIYQEDIESQNIVTKSSERTTYFMTPGYFLELKDSYFLGIRIMCYKPSCNWYYAQQALVVKFFGPELVKFDSKFPRTELLEVLNLKMKRKVFQFDSLYRVDFKDNRQLNEIQSLFFDMRSGLITKRTMVSNNEVIWEHTFSDFREVDGYLEPYQIDLRSNDELYYTINIESIQYNKKLDASMFDPPVPCKNEDSFEVLQSPYNPNF